MVKRPHASRRGANRLRRVPQRDLLLTATVARSPIQPDALHGHAPRRPLCGPGRARALGGRRAGVLSRPAVTSIEPPRSCGVEPGGKRVSPLAPSIRESVRSPGGFSSRAPRPPGRRGPDQEIHGGDGAAGSSGCREPPSVRRRKSLVRIVHPETISDTIPDAMDHHTEVRGA